MTLKEISQNARRKMTKHNAKNAVCRLEYELNALVLRSKAFAEKPVVYSASLISIEETCRNLRRLYGIENASDESKCQVCGGKEILHPGGIRCGHCD